MSILIHRCPACGHNDLAHNGPGVCSTGTCPCRSDVEAVRAAAPSEIVPTWDRDMNLLPEITKPGSRWPMTESGQASATTLCGCDGCLTLFGERSATVARGRR